MEAGTSTARSIEDLARAHFDAVARQDLDQIAADYAPDVVVDFMGNGIRRGRDEVRDFFAGLFGAIPDCEFITDRVIAGDDVAVVEWRLRGTFDGAAFEGIEPNGRWIDHRGCDVVDFSGELIERITAYQDGMEMARAIGMMPPLDSVPERAMKQAFNVATKARRALQDRFAQ
jgi:steroid delta-isomerase-like uncharacterized protein